MLPEHPDTDDERLLAKCVKDQTSSVSAASTASDVRLGGFRLLERLAKRQPQLGRRRDYQRQPVSLSSHLFGEERAGEEM
jgi:hypothetical protein